MDKEKLREQIEEELSQYSSALMAYQDWGKNAGERVNNLKIESTDKLLSLIPQAEPVCHVCKGNSVNYNNFDVCPKCKGTGLEPSPDLVEQVEGWLNNRLGIPNTFNRQFLYDFIGFIRPSIEQDARKQERERIIRLTDETLKEFDDHTRVGNFIGLLQHLRRESLSREANQ